MTPSARIGIVAAIALLVLTVAVVSGLTTSVAAPDTWSAVRIVRTAAVPAPPFVMFRTLAPARAHGRLAMTTGISAGLRAMVPLECLRVAFAGGRGLCMHDEASATSVVRAVTIFDSRFVRHQRLALAGIPIRARVSPDGRLGAITTYGEEESPEGERLATESFFVDLSSGAVLADLREFTLVGPGGAAVTGPIDIASPAFMRDSNGFFAAVSAPAGRFVVRGSVSARRLEVIAEGLWSEGLSPDETRLVAKRNDGEHGRWHLVVLDLATLTTTPLDQGARAVDDQVDWLDDRRVIFHDVSAEGTGIWAVPADGSGPPELLLPHAFSATVVR